MAKRITVRYYTFITSRRGIQTDPVETDAATVRELLHEIQAKRSLPLTTTISKASVNDKFVEWDDPFADGDCVTFLPPFSGG